MFNKGDIIDWTQWLYPNMNCKKTERGNVSIEQLTDERVLLPKDKHDEPRDTRWISS